MIEKITYTRGATVNRGNFNNTRHEISATASVEEGQDAADALDALRDFARRELKADIAAG